MFGRIRSLVDLHNWETWVETGSNNYRWLSANGFIEPHLLIAHYIYCSFLSSALPLSIRDNSVISQNHLLNALSVYRRNCGIQNGTVDIRKADGSIITLQEPYIKEPFSSNYTSIVIPPNEYFVMGDNRK